MQLISAMLVFLAIAICVYALICMFIITCVAVAWIDEWSEDRAAIFCDIAVFEYELSRRLRRQWPHGGLWLDPARNLNITVKANHQRMGLVSRPMGVLR
jgi:hypothetical protein